MAGRRTRPEAQLAGFIAKFEPSMQRLIRAARKRVRALLPEATELVYDNYNFLVIGYGPGARTSEAFLSLAAYARGLNLFFLHGAALPDPTRLLRGSGKTVRSIRLERADVLDRPEVRALIEAARGRISFAGDAKHALIIKLISAKQRPRRVQPPR